mmetsp:Transcript_52270/g.132047  ORF Transcript_52270/g.132047 Transcript_52270/m.132047 type:complete len:360 (+) Transcript_52270:83-1162(+)
MAAGSSRALARWLAGALLAAVCAAQTTEDTEVEACVPLCSFDASRTNQCHVSREYLTALVEAYDDGPWVDILASHANCEANLDNCTNMVECEIDAAGICAANRAWVASQLAAPEPDGAGLADRCGIFGRMLADGAVCLQEADPAACANVTAEGEGFLGCAWDPVREACDVSKSSILPVLRHDYQDELARVSLRRERCATALTSTMCSGDCYWDGQQCMLSPMDSLLAIAGEDCPLRTMLRQSEGCRSTVSESTCNLRVRADGMQECVWRSDVCEAHPMSLEFDLLMILDLGYPSLLDSLRAAQTQCLELAFAEECALPCAPAIGVPSSAFTPRRSSAVNALIGVVAACQAVLRSFSMGS